MMVLDTSFLIDLQREWAKDEQGVASRFLLSHGGEEFALSVITATEFLEGYEVSRDGEAFLEPFEWIDVTPAIARMTGGIRRTLRRTGRIIGDFDVLIGATALELGATLVTADTGHFEAIDKLSIESYR